VMQSESGGVESRQEMAFSPVRVKALRSLRTGLPAVVCARVLPPAAGRRGRRIPARSRSGWPTKGAAPAGLSVRAWECASGLGGVRNEPAHSAADRCAVA